MQSILATLQALRGVMSQNKPTGGKRENEENYENNERDNEEYFRDPGCRGGDAGEAEESGDNRDHKEQKGQFQHREFPNPLRVAECRSWQWSVCRFGSHSTANSSRLCPRASSSVSQRAGRPRPAQVSPVAGFRYLGAGDFLRASLLGARAAPDD